MARTTRYACQVPVSGPDEFRYLGGFPGGGVLAAVASLGVADGDLARDKAGACPCRHHKWPRSASVSRLSFRLRLDRLEPAPRPLGNSASCGRSPNNSALRAT